MKRNAARSQSKRSDRWENEQELACQQIVLLVRQGSDKHSAELESLFASIYVPVLALAETIVFSQNKYSPAPDAEELASQWLLEMWQGGFAGYTPGKPFLSFGYGALVNLSRNMARCTFRRRKRCRDCDFLDERPAAATSFDENSRQQLVERAINRLPPDERRVIIARYWNGKRTKGIASEIGMSPQTIDNLLHRARVRLRGMLSDCVG